MICTLTFAVTAACFSAPLPSSGLQPPPNTPQADVSNRFLTDAPKAWERHREMALKAHGKAKSVYTYSRNPPDPSKPDSMETDAQFKHGENSVVYWTRIKWFPSGEETLLVKAVNPAYAFELSGKPEGNWRITSLSNDTGKVAKRIDNLEPNVNAWTCCNLRIYDQWLPELIKQTGFVIKNVTVDSPAKDAPVRVEYEWPGRSGSPGRDGWFRLDPKREWVLIDYVFHRASMEKGVEELSEQSARYQYPNENRPDRPFSFPQQMTYIIKMLTRDAETRIDYDFDLYLQDAVPKKEFMLSAFGLAEPGVMTVESSWSSWQWWLVIAGILLVCAALALRYGKFPKALTK